MYFLKIIGLVFLSIAYSHGASFIFSSFERQVRDADAAVMGSVVGLDYKKLHTGEVVTEYTLDLNWKAGLKRSDETNLAGFKIISPGGLWQGINYTVSGSPQFEKGENVFLLLKKSSYGHSVLNLSLGKYHVHNKLRSGEIFLQSSVFPEHPKLKELSFEEVEKIMHDRFLVVQGLKNIHAPKLIINAEKEKREPASKSRATFSTPNASSKSTYWPFLALLILASLRFLSRLIFK